MGRVMAPGAVDAKTKEVVAFGISAANGCGYCINAHKQALGQYGFSDEAIAELLGVAALWEEVTRFAIGRDCTGSTDRDRRDLPLILP